MQDDGGEGERGTGERGRKRSNKGGQGAGKSAGREVGRPPGRQVGRSAGRQVGKSAGRQVGDIRIDVKFVAGWQVGRSALVFGLRHDEISCPIQPTSPDKMVNLKLCVSFRPP